MFILVIVIYTHFNCACVYWYKARAAGASKGATPGDLPILTAAPTTQTLTFENSIPLLCCIQ